MQLSEDEAELIGQLYEQARVAEALSTDEREVRYWEGYREALLTVKDLAGVIKLPSKEQETS